MKISEKLEKMLLKEEQFTITVPKKVAPLLAQDITGIKNVTVTKSFDLTDLERHRFVVSSMMDAHHIEDFLRDKIRRNPAVKTKQIKPEDVKVELFTKNSMNEAVKESIIIY